VGLFNVLTSTAVGALTGGPAGAFGGAVAGATQERAKTQVERARQQQREVNIMNPFELQSRNQRMLTANQVQTASPGFFAEGGALRGTLRDFGGFLGEFAPVASVFGLGDRFANVPPSGAQTINFTSPGETANSGELLGANLGLAPAILGQARNFLRTPGGQTALGFGAGALGAAFGGGQDGKPRITRRMKSDVRRIYMMAGMDPNMTAQILNNMGTYPRVDFNASLIFFILTKRFRNDGPVVTKAAVRKTKTTLRRMKGVVDMYNSVCKPTTRRAPMRRAAPKAVQLIKN